LRLRGSRNSRGSFNVVAATSWVTTSADDDDVM
jgi:hypothetical protein